MSGLAGDVRGQAASDPLRRAALALAGFAGWRRALAAFAAGALATTALAPTYFAPLLWISFPVLIWLLRGARTNRAAFLTGWWFAFGHFVFGLYWISVALWVDIARWWWAVPFAVAGLPALLAIFYGFGMAAYAALVRRFRLGGMAEALCFALVWTCTEWVRGHALTGFPWNLTGYAWTGWLPVLQAASVVGAYGLTLLTAAAASMPALLADGGRRRAGAAVLAGVALFAAIGGWGAWRMAGTEGRTAEGVTLRLVQPGIAQRDKGNAEARLDVFQRHLQLSVSPGWDRVTHVIWPETAVPFWIGNDDRITDLIGSVAPPDGLVIAGAPRLSFDGPDNGPLYRNALVAVDNTGRVVATYDKFHLVPFGEYMPLRALLPEGAVSAVAASAGDYTPGPGPRVLDLPGLPPVSPLICYEVIFPAAVTPEIRTGPEADMVAARPGWLLNLTNDAWYGRTAGPHQHFAIARVRAVEEGLPVVRSANTGISGVVDAYGRVAATLPLDQVGVLDASLPVAAPAPPTYAVWGDAVLGLCLLFVAALIGILARRS